MFMPLDKMSRRAVQIGRARADEVIAFRKTALRRRSKAIAKRAGGAPRARAAAERVAVPKFLGSAAESSGVLVAEGDSWFDYPWTDILRLLEDEHGYDVESVAHKGDRVEEMAYSGGQLEELSRNLEKLLRSNKIPRAILLSGGGNDVAGPEFGMLLNHAASAIAGLNDQVISGVIDQRIRMAYLTILAAITKICQTWLQRPLPILVHGYDYPVPDGRGFLGGLWVLPGPWLEPGFREKGFADIDTRKGLAKQVIDRFNKMLSEVAAEFAHVTYVDLRNTLSSGSNYKQSWANELHPTPKGFGLVTNRFVKALDSLPG
jgi:lysophospholipase L1-like esterase